MDLDWPDRPSVRGQSLSLTAYFDTHCHLNRYDDPIAALTRAENAQVQTFAVTETPSEFRMMQLLLGKRSSVRVALGMHPLRASMVRDVDCSMFSEMLDRTEVVGEVGLDGTERGKPSFDRQLELFEWILGESSIRSKLLSVHSRGAEQETIDRIRMASATAVLHWYTGSTRHTEDALNSGCYFSINSAMLRTKKGRALVALLPVSRVLTETDGPYAKNDNREACPSDIPIVIESLATQWGMTNESAAQQVAKNLSEALDVVRQQAVA